MSVYMLVCVYGCAFACVGVYVGANQVILFNPFRKRRKSSVYKSRFPSVCLQQRKSHRTKKKIAMTTIMYPSPPPPHKPKGTLQKLHMRVYVYHI